MIEEVVLKVSFSEDGALWTQGEYMLECIVHGRVGDSESSVVDVAGNAETLRLGESRRRRTEPSGLALAPRGLQVKGVKGKGRVQWCVPANLQPDGVSHGCWPRPGG